MARSYGKYLKKVREFKEQHMGLGGFRKVDDECPVCGKYALMSYVVVDNAPCIDNRQSCGHICLACGFTAMTSRDCGHKLEVMQKKK